MSEIIIAVKVTTRASSNKIGDYVIGADDKKYLKIYVTAIAENSKANIAVIKLLSKHFKVAKSNVTIISGASDSYKLIKIIN